MSEDVFPRAEVEAAFQHMWSLGPSNDLWDEWARCFTADAYYIEHLFGEFHGAEEIERFVCSVMLGATDCYAKLDWYNIDGNRVVLQSQNRRDDPEGPHLPPIDFVGWEILEYAGDGKFSFCRDIYWYAEARAAASKYHAKRRKFDPDHPAKRTRWHLPEGVPAWQLPAPGVEPTWMRRTNLVKVVRPSDLTFGVRREQPA